MFYTFVRFIAWVLLKIFWKMEIIGLENIPKEGSLIVAANHTSNLDPVILGAAFNRKMNFIAKKEVFNNFIGNFVCKRLNAFPVDRKKIDIKALKHALDVLQNKEVLGIFPEGTRSINGELQDFKLGIIKIAMKTGAPILPVGIDGAHQIFPRGKIIPAFFKHKIVVRYGSVQYLQSDKSKDKNYQLESLKMLSSEIKKLTSSNNHSN